MDILSRYIQLYYIIGMIEKTKKIGRGRPFLKKTVHRIGHVLMKAATNDMR